MNTVRKILVPDDFSEDSANGLTYSVSLAQKTQAELIVLHVTQKSEADSFLDLLAVMEGAPTLNRPAGIPVDRLLREKALDLYHFIEKVVSLTSAFFKADLFIYAGLQLFSVTILLGLVPSFDRLHYFQGNPQRFIYFSMNGFGATCFADL